MNKNKFNGPITMLTLLIDKIFLFFYKILSRLIYGSSANNFYYKFDLNTTDIDIDLLPFYIDEMSLSNFKDIITDFPYSDKYVYVFDSKGELIYFSIFFIKIELESQMEDKKLL